MKKHLTLLSCLYIAAIGLRAASILAADEEIATTFKFTDPKAAKVEVAGEFSNWKIMPMTKGDGGTWSTTLHLKPGYYGYKFVVNGEWVLDPANPTHKMVSDIENSAVSVAGVQPPAGGGGGTVSGKVPVTFAFSDANAKSVHVAGEFNSWLDNVDGKVTGHAEWQLQNDGAGNWKLTALLSPGKFKFKYVINGGERWEQDPAYPASTDGNSIIEVKAGAGQPAAPAAAAAAAAPVTGGVPVSFAYADPSAKSVTVAGEFNHWNASADPLQKDATRIWTATISLKPGKYQYKLVVDGVWKQDLTNPESQDDGLGGKNSVKIVTQ